MNKLAKKNIRELTYAPESYKFGIYIIDSNPPLKSYIIEQIKWKGLHHARIDQEIKQFMENWEWMNYK